METSDFAFSENGKSSLLDFKPDFQITYLKKVTYPAVKKSPSWPSSPSVLRSTSLVQESDIPAYLTLSRRKLHQKVSDDDFDSLQVNTKRSSDPQLEEIKALLSSLDLAKYRRKTNESPSHVDSSREKINRSISVQPDMNLNSYISNKKSLLDNIPPPPKTKLILENSSISFDAKREIRDKPISLELKPIKRSQRTVNTKLKELTEKLRPASAPPSPRRKLKSMLPYTAPPTSNFSFFKDPLPDKETTLGPPEEEDIENRYSAKEFLQSLEKNANIQRKKLSSMTKVLSSTNPKYATLPRTKPGSVKSSLEPRTLASLDLNVNLKPEQSYEICDIKNNNLESSFPFEKNNKKLSQEALKENKESSTKRSLQRQASFESDTEPSAHSRRGSLKNNAAKQRSEFDLNFSKYGSLTHPPEKLNDRKKGVHKIETKSFDVPNKLGKYDSKLVRQSSDVNNKLVNSFEQENFGSSDEDKCTDMQRDNPSNDAAEQPTKNANEVKSNSTIPLEEEIRTIAKLLDGKESLFLKLIQSSKYGNASESGTFSETNSQDLPSALGSPQCSEIGSVSSRTATHINNATGRSSPSRLRSMTVSGTEINRAQENANTSSPPQQKRYFKKRLRGPYGEMLEQEMSKSINKTRPSYAKDLEFLKELDVLSLKNNDTEKMSKKPRPLVRSSSHSFDESHSISVEGTPKRKTSANIPIVGNGNAQDDLGIPKTAVTVSDPILHIRSHSDSVKTSSTWNVESAISGILKQPPHQDTRTHIVGELYETELSYVESLQIIVKKYMTPLKSSEHVAEIESAQVDQIFCGVPEILKFHEGFLEVLKNRLSYWDTKQKIGDVFVDVFTRTSVVDTYIEFINNWKSARETIKSVSLAKPAFAKFLEHTSREHKGKLTLDALLIMPVQRIPRYELLIKELLKHTPMDHPDYKLLLQAQKEVHDLAININRVEREALQQEQTTQKLKEIEHLIEGVVDLSQGDRAFIRHDFVLIPGGLGMKKERCLFLFSDLLLISSIKKKGAIRKTSLAINSSAGSLESNKYKLLMRTPLHNVDIVKRMDEPCVIKFLKEVSSLENDVSTLGKINDMMRTLSCHHQNLDEAVKELLSNLNKQLSDKQASSSIMMSIELTITINDETENIVAVFPSPEQRMMWEVAFIEAKEKLDKSSKISTPEFLCSLPLRKTRAGLLVTCAAAVVDSCQSGLPDLWICSSDGFVGQVSVLTFQNEPVVASCVSVSNARILCIAAVPGFSSGSFLSRRRSILLPYLPGFKYERLGNEDKSFPKERSFPLDSDTDEDEFIDAAEDSFSSDDLNIYHPTMWLGTEDGCIYVYNSADVKLKKAQFKVQHSTCIYDILHVNGQVFVSLANGEIAIYSRDPAGFWNINNPQKIQVATDISPISKMVHMNEDLWCSSLNSVVIIDTLSLESKHTFQVTAEVVKHVTNIVPSSQGVWITVQSSPVIHLYDIATYVPLMEVNVSLTVTKMLSSCDDIIRQHKLACLRVSALCVQKDLLWIGTSAGVVLNGILPIAPITEDSQLDIKGLLYGHSGHVRFLTSVCAPSGKDPASPEESTSQLKASTSSASPYSEVVISGGDGYEHFFSTVETEAAGRDDSTNHLLMWRV